MSFSRLIAILLSIQGTFWLLAAMIKRDVSYLTNANIFLMGMAIIISRKDFE